MEALSTRELFKSLNPATEQDLGSYPLMSDFELEQKLAATWAAGCVWRGSTVGTRSAVLTAIAGTLRAQQEPLSHLIIAEMGKTYVSALAEVEKCAMACLFYAPQGPLLLEDRLVPLAAGHATIKLLPLGVVLAIMPWNFPFWQAFRFIAPALMAGNAILLKHATNVPQCAKAIERIVGAALVLAETPKASYQNLFICQAPTCRRPCRRRWPLVCRTTSVQRVREATYCPRRRL